MRPTLQLVKSVDQPRKAPLCDQPLLAFKQEGPPLAGVNRAGVVEVSFDDATRNVIVFGGTGRGKTAAVLLPAADRLIEAGCAGLILDVKGDFIPLARRYPKRVALLGPGLGQPINLLSGIGVSALRGLLDTLRRNHGHRDPYWGSMAVEDSVLIAAAIQETGREATLADIHDHLVDPDRFCVWLERGLRSWPHISATLEGLIQSRKIDEFSILSAGGFQGYEAESSRVREQYSWQTNALLKALSPFAQDPTIRTAFCHEGPSAAHGWLDLRRILVLDISSDRYPDCSQTIGRIVRHQFMRTIIEQRNNARAQAVDEPPYTFLLIDECQHHLHVNTDQDGDALRDDNAWFDRSRSYRHINIMATQSLHSLLARASLTAVMSIVQNFQTTLALPTTDSITLDRVSELIGQTQGPNPVTHPLLNPSQLGVGFIHIAQHRRSNGGSLAAHIRTAALTDGRYSYMNRHIHPTRVNRPKRREPTPMPDMNTVANPHHHSPPAITPSGRLFVLLDYGDDYQRQWLAKAAAHPRLAYVSWLNVGNSDTFWMLRDETGVILGEMADGDLLVAPFPGDSGTQTQLERMLRSILDRLRDRILVLTTFHPSRITPSERLADEAYLDEEALLAAVHERLNDRK